jgi:hypothetical protein
MVFTKEIVAEFWVAGLDFWVAELSRPGNSTTLATSSSGEIATTNDQRSTINDKHKYLRRENDPIELMQASRRRGTVTRKRV